MVNVKVSKLYKSLGGEPIGKAIQRLFQSSPGVGLKTQFLVISDIKKPGEYEFSISKEGAVLVSRRADELEVSAGTIEFSSVGGKVYQAVIEGSYDPAILSDEHLKQIVDQLGIIVHFTWRKTMRPE